MRKIVQAALFWFSLWLNPAYFGPLACAEAADTPTFVGWLPPQSYFPHELLSSYQKLSTGAYQEAMSELKRTAGLNPALRRDDRFALLKGVIHSRLGQSDDAATFLQKSLSIRANSRVNIYFSGMAALARSDYQSAIRAGEDALWFTGESSVVPESEIHTLLGAAYLKAGNFPKARDALVKATSLKPISPAAIFYRAELALAQGNKKEAIGFLSKARQKVEDASAQAHSIDLKLATALLMGAHRVFDAPDIAQAAKLARGVLSAAGEDQELLRTASALVCRAAIELNDHAGAHSILAGLGKPFAQEPEFAKLARQLQIEEEGA